MLWENTANVEALSRFSSEAKGGLAPLMTTMICARDAGNRFAIPLVSEAHNLAKKGPSDFTVRTVFLFLFQTRSNSLLGEVEIVDKF